MIQEVSDGSDAVSGIVVDSLPEALGRSAEEAVPRTTGGASEGWSGVLAGGDGDGDARSGSNPLDVQEGGNHYKIWKIQPVEFAMTNGLDLCQANVVKYTCRFRLKGGIEDLRKAKHYLELLAHFEYDEAL